MGEGRAERRVCSSAVSQAKQACGAPQAQSTAAERETRSKQERQGEGEEENRRPGPPGSQGTRTFVASAHCPSHFPPLPVLS